MKKKKAIAIALVVVYCIVMLFSISYIAIESNHDCTGVNCPICFEIKACTTFLNKITQTMISIILLMFTGFVVARCLNVMKRHFDFDTLVSLKVELRD